MNTPIAEQPYRVLQAERYLVFGAARSGRAAAKLLKSQGRDVFVRDEGDPAKLAEAGAFFQANEIPYAFEPSDFANLDRCDAIILSPGIPTVHPLLVEARRRGIGVYSELELGFACSPAEFVAITGSNGKTTTTQLVAHFLRTAGVPTIEAGNIGHPLCEAIQDPECAKKGAVISLEVSSFQLETIDQFRPRVAIVLNVTPDHMDRYENSMELYAAAKQRITMNQTPDDALIVNQDDACCLSMLQHSQAEPWAFSTIRPVERGGYLSEDVLMAGSGKMRRLASLDEVPLRGMHNISNILAAASAACFLRLSFDSIRQSVVTATAPRHRLQPVGEVNGVAFYNDSKATNIDAVVKALESFSDPVILLAGGRDKNSPFVEFAGTVRGRIKRLIVFGEAGPAIARAWGAGIVTVDVPDLPSAVRAASEAAVPGDVVLLSPACASFDQFRNYEERGDVFIRCVEELADERVAP